MVPTDRLTKLTRTERVPTKHGGVGSSPTVSAAGTAAGATTEYGLHVLDVAQWVERHDAFSRHLPARAEG
jgi:hypothetical protein